LSQPPRAFHFLFQHFLFLFIFTLAAAFVEAQYGGYDSYGPNYDPYYAQHYAQPPPHHETYFDPYYSHHHAPPPPQYDPYYDPHYSQHHGPPHHYNPHPYDSYQDPHFSDKRSPLPGGDKHSSREGIFDFDGNDARKAAQSTRAVADMMDEFRSTADDESGMFDFLGTLESE
jgi:hypothetical protein